MALDYHAAVYYGGCVSFGTLLSEAREAASVTQRFVAERLGIAASHVSDVECGHRPPFEEARILQAAKILNADPVPLLQAASLYWHGIHLVHETTDDEEAPPRGRYASAAAALAAGWAHLTAEELARVEGIGRVAARRGGYRVVP